MNVEILSRQSHELSEWRFEVHLHSLMKLMGGQIEVVAPKSCNYI